MDDVIPSYYDISGVGEEYNSSYSNNILLRAGEVIQLITPDNQRSRSKRFFEYDVLATHTENNVSITKVYHNCILNNPFGSVDYERFVLRPQTKTTPGAAVLLLCIEGESPNAVILGGLRQENQSDSGFKGYEFNFNGLNIAIADDGSYLLKRNGPTGETGELKEGVDEGDVGQFLNLDSSGDVELKSSSSTRLKLEKSGTSTLHGSSIKLGNEADKTAVCGEDLIQILEEILDAIVQITVTNAGGPSTPPRNIQDFLLIRAKLRIILSNVVKLKK